MNRMIFRGSMLLLLAFLLFSGCETDPNADIKDVTLSVDFKRIDPFLYQAAKYLREEKKGDFLGAYEQFLKPEKDFLYYFAQLDQIEQVRGPIPLESQDSVIAYQLGGFLADSTTLWLLDTIQQVFPPDYDFESRLTPLLKRYHLAFPEVEIPAFRTHVNGYDPQGIPELVDQTMATPGFYSLGLHYFMGRNFPFYSVNLPQYIRNRFDPAYLEVIVAQDLVAGTITPLPRTSQPTLLNKMIAEGIKLYVVDKIIPHVPDSMKLFYSTDETYWAEFYEREIFKELAPKFYTTGYQEHKKYLDESSFTQGLSTASAPRIGAYCGWKIVSAYMDKNPDLSLADLCQTTDYEQILKASRYKP